MVIGEVKLEVKIWVWWIDEASIEWQPYSHAAYGFIRSRSQENEDEDEMILFAMSETSEEDRK